MRTFHEIVADANDIGMYVGSVFQVGTLWQAHFNLSYPRYKNATVMSYARAATPEEALELSLTRAKEQVARLDGPRVDPIMDLLG